MDKKYLDDLRAELANYKKKLSHIKEHLKGKSGQETEKIQKSLQKIFQEANDSYSQLKSASSDEWGPMKKLAAKAFDDLETSFHAVTSSSAEQLKNYSQEVLASSGKHLGVIEDYVSEHPVRSILFAAGAGFILGRILK